MTDISQHFQTIGQALQFAQQSHIANGQNLANVNTPNYKTREVSFQQLLSTLESNSTGPKQFELQQTKGLVARSDGNNVDMDRELAMLKKNTLAFQTLTQLLGSKMGIISRAITG